ncbi:IclR family transcriptional regulator domain-containing protein [Streptomyces benahoarensis]|uniref:IclR family transcriptional regulator n=1 Tax=Streptomyces benahoarensis TaxID=2595054 RepID=A0A553ZBQ4_9ACTN|nr:IclR family transcriptional regulator C-terminal domain-containing protein [Streptomyces benahoarensis]TSB31867.1 IclR family transcriptional regulator [Streptomyces benahoarensis]TSB38851.1 IclR family transcriptional regulator [Streptomyces benahoarensis]
MGNHITAPDAAAAATTATPAGPPPAGATVRRKPARRPRVTAGTARATGSSHAERVFLVQTAFAELGGSAHGPGEIAEFTGLDDSVVYRILQSGIYQRIFERVDRGLYRLRTSAAQLAFTALDHRLDGAASQMVLRELRMATDGGLAFLYMVAPFSGAQRQCVDMAVGDSDLAELGMTPRDVLSVTRSLRTGASGRTILAYLPQKVQQRVLAEPVPDQAGPGVYRDNDALSASLAEIRDLGHALGYEECMAGWNSCAAPIIWDGAIMGAVLLLKLKSVMPEAPDGVIEATKEAAAELSRHGAARPAADEV